MFSYQQKLSFCADFGWIFGKNSPEAAYILTSDDKQEDASDMLQLFEVFRNGLSWVKKLIFWLILRPMKHTPRFCQMKNFIKIYICGKFH